MSETKTETTKSSDETVRLNLQQDTPADKYTPVLALKKVIPHISGGTFTKKQLEALIKSFEKKYGKSKSMGVGVYERIVKQYNINMSDVNQMYDTINQFTQSMGPNNKSRFGVVGHTNITKLKSFINSVKSLIREFVSDERMAEIEGGINSMVEIPDEEDEKEAEVPPEEEKEEESQQEEKDNLPTPPQSPRREAEEVDEQVTRSLSTEATDFVEPELPSVNADQLDGTATADQLRTVTGAEEASLTTGRTESRSIHPDGSSIEDSELGVRFVTPHRNGTLSYPKDLKGLLAMDDMFLSMRQKYTRTFRRFGKTMNEDDESTLNQIDNELSDRIEALRMVSDNQREQMETAGAGSGSGLSVPADESFTTPTRLPLRVERTIDRTVESALGSVNPSGQTHRPESYSEPANDIPFASMAQTNQSTQASSGHTRMREGASQSHIIDELNETPQLRRYQLGDDDDDDGGSDGGGDGGGDGGTAPPIAPNADELPLPPPPYEEDDWVPQPPNIPPPMPPNMPPPPADGDDDDRDNRQPSNIPLYDRLYGLGQQPEHHIAHMEKAIKLYADHTLVRTIKADDISKISNKKLNKLIDCFIGLFGKKLNINKRKTKPDDPRKRLEQEYHELHMLLELFYLNKFQQRQPSLGAVIPVEMMASLLPMMNGLNGMMGGMPMGGMDMPQQQQQQAVYASQQLRPSMLQRRSGINLSATMSTQQQAPPFPINSRTERISLGQNSNTRFTVRQNARDFMRLPVRPQQRK